MDCYENWDNESDGYDSDDRPSAKLEAELETICVREFAELELPAREMLLDPILPQRGLGMLFAGRGIGKTHVALGIAYAVSCGGEFLRWKAEKARNVLYVDGEMPQQALQERLIGLIENSEIQPDEGAFRLLCMDRQTLGTSINLSNAKHQEMINHHLGDAEFLVLDNMSTLMNGGPENDAESWISMQAWLLQLRRQGATVLIVHHASRGGNARGTSKREDVLDTIVQLKHPADYSPADGARFEVHLTKARGVFGDDAAPFEARLDSDDGGRALWVCTDLKESDEDDLQVVSDRSAAGKSVREIAEELKMPKSTVHRLLQKSKRLRKAEPAVNRS